MLTFMLIGSTITQPVLSHRQEEALLFGKVCQYVITDHYIPHNKSHTGNHQTLSLCAVRKKPLLPCTTFLLYCPPHTTYIVYHKVYHCLRHHNSSSFVDNMPVRINQDANYFHLQLKNRVCEI